VSFMQEREIKSRSFEELSALGFFPEHSFGIQIDLNVAWGKENSIGSAISSTAKQTTLLPIREGHICDHNCTLRSEANPNGGGYACPAAFTLLKNRGLDPRSLASLHDILTGIYTATTGLRSQRPQFLRLLKRLGYSQEIIDGMAGGSSFPEINLFGGNPEMHPYIHEIIAQLIQEGYAITLTTTGKKFLTSPEFVKRMKEHPPTKIALSADDLPPDAYEIRRLAVLSQSELRTEYKKILPTAGQKQKAVEAISVLNLSQLDTNFSPIILNFVLHPGNIERAMEMMQLLGELYPNAKLNPYPAQSAFSRESPILTSDHVSTLEQIIDGVIERHFTQLEGSVDFKVVPRLHYHLLLKAVFLAYPNDPQRTSEILSGYGLWRCYEEPLLSSRYLQIGAGGVQPLRPIPNGDGKRPSPGGHPGCFWNTETVTNSKITIWNSTPQQVGRHIAVGMQNLAEKSKYPCPGCGFPRLVFDEPSVIAGIPHSLGNNPVLTNYLTLRRKYGGY
jgi:Radical SAM superfamily